MDFVIKKNCVKIVKEVLIIYSLSKIIFSDLIKYFLIKKEGKFRIMRIFPTYGSGDQDKIVSKIKKMQRREKYVLNPFEIRISPK